MALKSLSYVRLCSPTQDDSTINFYYTRFEVVWDELSNYRFCSCGHQIEECTMALLIGLNKSYGVVKGQILLMEPMPALHKVFSLVLQEEKQRKVGLG